MRKEKDSCVRRVLSEEGVDNCPKMDYDANQFQVIGSEKDNRRAAGKSGSLCARMN